jgi:hypothetical protein
MRPPRYIRYICYASLAVAVSFAGLWVRSYWYDTFLGYEARVTHAHVNHHYWTATDRGAFDIAIQWESLSPSYKRERGIWSFYDHKREPPTCGVVGKAQPSFLGFQHWIVESPDSYRYNYTWIPFWFPTLLFLSLPLWYYVRTKLTPNQSPEPTAVGAGRSAIAVHVASRRWLSFFR